MTVRNSQTYDQLLLLKDAGVVTASGNGTVSGSQRAIDVGPAMFNAKVIIDSSAVAGTGTYRVTLQGSNDVSFATGVVELGSVAVTATGRAEMHFTNQQGDTQYRYLRSTHTLGGTTPSINFTAFIGKH